MTCWCAAARSYLLIDLESIWKFAETRLNSFFRRTRISGSRSVRKVLSCQDSTSFILSLRMIFKMYCCHYITMTNFLIINLFKDLHYKYSSKYYLHWTRNVIWAESGWPTPFEAIQVYWPESVRLVLVKLSLDPCSLRLEPHLFEICEKKKRIQLWTES